MNFAMPDGRAFEAQKISKKGLLMKNQLLIALTFTSLAFADRGNNFSGGNSSILKGNEFSNAGIIVGNPADEVRGNNFSSGRADSMKGGNFSSGASSSGGSTFQDLLEWLSEYGNSSSTGDDSMNADKNQDNRVDFRDFLMILSGY
ncbi:MAG: hypothetical protein CMJ28_01845 [Phycisphaerae bacterium]|nr:hypothetical protein [Phycisphaerae bacterium]